ncbi:MAG: hypothetical protein KGL39_58005 [Patescibacteria group bacterium]|nr:hypothetical protein [Patescibacteria group bacterium]
METREFPTAVIASISSGIALCRFSEIHEAAEYLMGCPIWTHHFASKKLLEAMKRKVLEQCAGMPTALEGVTPENYRERLAEIEAELGPVAVIRKGDGSTSMHPLDGISEGKSTIVIGKG